MRSFKAFYLFTIFGCNISNSLFAQDLLYLDGSGATANLTIQSGADVYVEGGYVANSGASGMKVDGNLYVGKTSGAATANWTDNMSSSSVLSTSTGTVYLQSNIGQNVTGPNTKFYNLYLNNSSANTSGIQLLSNIEVGNQLTFNDGLVYANSYTLYVSSNAANAVVYGPSNTATYSNSWINALYSNGKLDRSITSGSTYDFPVGSSSAAQLFQATTSAGFSGVTRFSANWESSIPGGTSPLSLTECGTPYNQLSSGGEWHLRPANGGTYGSGSMSSGTITLLGWNLSTFSPLTDNQFALLTRADGNSLIGGWVVPNPSCTSLSSINTAGRTVSGNVAKRNNLTSYSDATSQWAIGISNFVLPIELLVFTGYNEGTVNILNWTTASEFNSDYFDVERSLSGEDYSSVGTVKAAGFSSTEKKYSLTDYSPNHGLNYYRLKMVDRDETFKYSSIILINLVDQIENSSATIVSPNPTNGQLNIQFTSNESAEVMIDLIDELGRIIRVEKWNVNSGINTLSFDLNNLPAAVYYLTLHHQGDNSESFKVVKVK